MTDIKAVCVFCGASNNVAATFLDVGKTFGELLVTNNIKLVYGGGDCGIMGAVANSVLKNKGYVTGVFPRSLKDLESEHASLSEIIMVESMHERKRIMFERSDAIVVLPGGFGTMDEMFEIITWKQLRFHQKKILILNHEGYWDKLISLMNNIIDVGFAREEVRSFYEVHNTPEGIIKALK